MIAECVAKVVETADIDQAVVDVVAAVVVDDDADNNVASWMVTR